MNTSWVDMLNSSGEVGKDKDLQTLAQYERGAGRAVAEARDAQRLKPVSR
ncbi:MAG: hypothetical protein VB934_23115 [Polyangiaceae bacterium]